MTTSSWYVDLFADEATRSAVRRDEKVFDRGAREIVKQQRDSSAAVTRTLSEVRQAADAIGFGLAGLAQIQIEQSTRTLDALHRLQSRFEWRLDQILDQFSAQTKALEDIREVLRNPIDTQARELWRRAQFAVERKLWKEAAEDYQLALQTNRYLYPAHMQLAFIQAYHLRQRDAAILSFASAARYAEQDDPLLAAQANLQLCQFKRDDGDIGAAYEHAMKASTLDASLAPAWWDRCTLAVQLGKDGDAGASLDRAIRFDPMYWHRAHLELGIASGSSATDSNAVASVLQSKLAEAQRRYDEAKTRWQSLLTEADRYNEIMGGRSVVPVEGDDKRNLPTPTLGYAVLLTSSAELDRRSARIAESIAAAALAELRVADDSLLHARNQLAVEVDAQTLQVSHREAKTVRTGGQVILLGLAGVVFAAILLFSGHPVWGAFVVAASAMVITLGVKNLSSSMPSVPLNTESSAKSRRAGLEERQARLDAYSRQLASFCGRKLDIASGLDSHRSNLLKPGGRFSYLAMSRARNTAMLSETHLVAPFGLRIGIAVRGTVVDLCDGGGLMVELYRGRQEVVPNDRIRVADEGTDAVIAKKNRRLQSSFDKGGRVPLVVQEIMSNGRLKLDYCNTKRCLEHCVQLPDRKQVAPPNPPNVSSIEVPSSSAPAI